MPNSPFGKFAPGLSAKLWTIPAQARAEIGRRVRARAELAAAKRKAEAAAAAKAWLKEAMAKDKPKPISFMKWRQASHVPRMRPAPCRPRCNLSNFFLGASTP